MVGRLNAFGALLRAFARAKNANVAMIFGLSLVPMILAAGAGLDYARAVMVRQSMGEALDAAALAIGKTDSKPASCAANSTDTACTALLQMAQQYFAANYTYSDPSYAASYGTPSGLTMTIANESVTLTVNDSVPTEIVKWVKPTIPVTATTTVVWGQTKLWVALVLDNTGSMCEPDSQPCTTDTNPNIKMNALKTAAKNLITTLSSPSVSANPGDVQVAIVPFAKDVNVGTANVGASWIDWSDWNTTFPGTAPSTSVGPGSNCPWSSSSYGCLSGPGMTGSVTTVPGNGMICPGSVPSSSTGQTGHYYDGCFNSTPTKTLTTTVVQTTVTTTKQSCTQTGSGTITCVNNSGYPSTASPTSSTTTATTSGYTGNSGPTVTNSTTGSTTDGTKSCTGRSPNQKCTWTRTILSNALVTTVTATGAAPYSHTWIINDHSVWAGCVMDRNQSDDVNDATPGTLFPAENDDSCPSAAVSTLSYNWTALDAQIDAMTAGGGTNQTIGLAHGMQILMDGAPYNAGTLPGNTTRYIILLSDGLNTMDRWYGNGSAQSTSVDARMTLACNNAKAQQYVIYTIFVDLGGASGNSAVLQSCATDSTKYFHLTTAGAIITAFDQIAQQITHLRLAE